MSDIQKYTPKTMLQEIQQSSIRKITTIQKAINYGTKDMVLSKIRKDHGEQTIEVLISAIIEDFLNFVTVKNKMSKDNIRKTANLIATDYYMLRISEVAFIFRRAKTGYYGDLYNRVDGLVVMSWFKKYLDERFELIEQERQNERKENKELELTAKVDDEKINKIIEQIKKKFTKKIQIMDDEKKTKTAVGVVSNVEHFFKNTPDYSADKIANLVGVSKDTVVDMLLFFENADYKTKTREQVMGDALLEFEDKIKKELQ